MTKPANKLKRLGRGLKAAAAAFGKTQDQFAIAGKRVTCPHCGAFEFDGREILLNTRGATFLNLDWLNQGATALTCKRCSRIEWFNESPEVLE